MLMSGAASYLLSNLGGLPELCKLLVSLAVAPAQLLQLGLQRVANVAHGTQLLFHCPAAWLAPAHPTFHKPSLAPSFTGQWLTLLAVPEHPKPTKL